LHKQEISKAYRICKLNIYKKKVSCLILGDFLIEYENRKDEKHAFRKICKENNISYKKLSDLLKSFSFAYDQKQKSWIYQKEGAAPLEIDLLSAIPARQAAAQQPEASQQEAASTAEEVQQHKEHATYTAHKPAAEEVPQQHSSSIVHDQLFDIVDLLQQINKKLPARKEITAADPIESDPQAAPLALQLHRINQSDKARKTINLSAEAASWLDSFSATKGFKIGDLVSLAVIQLKERIDQR
jgi:hypothetical protein